MQIKIAHYFLFLFILFILVAVKSHAQEERAPEKSAAPILRVENPGQPQWLPLEPGLEFYEFRTDETAPKISVLRIDPEYFEFVLGAAGQNNEEPRTLKDWANDLNLKAAINASMYLPDNKTSTGYMRSGDYVNNPKIMGRFGTFFVANPKQEGLPKAMLLDKDSQNWEDTLAQYDLAIQNYRMTNNKRQILWSPGGPLYSISAVAQDGHGKILFLHSRMPVEAYSFVQQLLHLPLDVRTVMYVEGGAQAGLLVSADNFRRDLSGPHAPSFMVTGNLKALLPNIIGIRPKQKLNKIVN